MNWEKILSYLPAITILCTLIAGGQTLRDDVATLKIELAQYRDEAVAARLADKERFEIELADLRQSLDDHTKFYRR